MLTSGPDIMLASTVLDQDYLLFHRPTRDKFPLGYVIGYTLLPEG